MADAALATLHTPWDCRWSRFARRTSAARARRGLWDCVHSGERVEVAATDCASCQFWEYQPAREGSADRTAACECSTFDRSTRAVEAGLRVSLLVIAVIFAACGFVVLTGPLAVPFTITLWIGAAASLMLGIFGNFRSHADGSFRGFLPPRA